MLVRIHWLAVSMGYWLQIPSLNCQKIADYRLGREPGATAIYTVPAYQVGASAFCIAAQPARGSGMRRLAPWIYMLELIYHA
jgi:hypothetical protein